jgi:hypothetical protein
VAKKKNSWLTAKNVKFDVRPYWPFLLMGGVVTIAVWMTMRKVKDAAASVEDTTRDVQSLVAIFRKKPPTVSTTIVGIDRDLDPET